MTACIGISALYHDSACCLIREARVVAAAQEERFSRMKFDPRVPLNAFDFCLSASGLTTRDIQCVGYYENPSAKLDRIAWSLSQGIGEVRPLLQSWEEKTATLEFLADKLDFTGEIRSYDHHLSHCASAYYASSFENAAILTADGVGEWTTTSLASGIDGRVRILESIDFPHSLGLFYSAITSFLGFQPNSDEYKVMGLAAFGTPTYRKQLQRIIDIDERGFFRLDMTYFDYNHNMYSAHVSELLGIQPRKPGTEVRREHKDIAATAQELLEEALIHLARHLYERTRLTDLCLAGGVALNCVANSRLQRDSPFSRIFVQPAAGDAGGALGAAMLAYNDVSTLR